MAFEVGIAEYDMFVARGAGCGIWIFGTGIISLQHAKQKQPPSVIEGCHPYAKKVRLARGY